MQMPLGEMEIDGRILEPLMAHQQLNGAQVGAGFEEMRRKAVPQHVRMDLLRECGACSRDAASVPDGLVRDGLIDAALTCRAGEQIAMRLLPSPPAAQFFEQLRGERHIPITRTLALADVDHHCWLSMSSTLMRAASVRRTPVA